MRDIRESQFELLRIVAIFFVILHHLIVKGADTAGYITDYNIHNHGILGIVLNSVVVGGVNLFVLISGWFGIKRMVRGIIRLLIDCIIFGLISYLILVSFSEHNFNLTECIKSCNASANWFVVSYIMLLIISPIVEYTLRVEYATLSKWIVLLTIFNIIFGYGMGRENTNGYNAVHFIYLYYIGRFLKMSIDRFFGGTMSKYGILFFFLLSGCVALPCFAMSYFWGPINTRLLFAYNNPFVLLASIALFVWFANLKLKSHYINFIATSVFGIYILHTTKFVIAWRNAIAHDTFINDGYFGLFIMGVAIFVICGVIGLVVNPITYRLTDLAHRCVESVWNRKMIHFRKKT